jgi:enamine deaminase RidA (YjgF/YER057c/UK114 family)
MRKKVPADPELAKVFPYSRLVRVGNVLEVCGTGAHDEEGNPVGIGDFYAQTKNIYGIIEKALAAAGASLADVVKITIFSTDMAHWPEVARAHKEYFEGLDPAVTMVGVTELITPEMLVEIEATAILS